MVCRQRQNWKRFSRSGKSMWNDFGPTASTFDTIVVSLLLFSASDTLSLRPSGVLASITLGTPDALAMPARSVPVDVAVGKPPTERRLSLSKTMCRDFLV